MILRREIERNLVHLIAGIILALLIKYDYLDAARMLILLVVTFMISVIAKDADLPWISWFFNRFDRPEDKHFPGKGPFYMVAGSTVAVMIFSKDIAIASIIILALGDSLSHIFGRAYGKRKHFLSKNKMWEGSVVGTIAGALGAWLIIPFWAAFLASAIAMIVEAVELKVHKWKIDDNLTIPIVAGLILTLLL